MSADSRTMADTLALVHEGMSAEAVRDLVRIAYWRGEIAGYRACADDVLAKLPAKEAPCSTT